MDTTAVTAIFINIHHQVVSLRHKWHFLRIDALAEMTGRRDLLPWTTLSRTACVSECMTLWHGLLRSLILGCKIIVYDRL